MIRQMEYKGGPQIRPRDSESVISAEVEETVKNYQYTTKLLLTSYGNGRTTQRSGNRGNSRKLGPTRARLDIRKYSFSERTTQIWNSLPDKVVCAKSLNSCKTV